VEVLLIWAVFGGLFGWWGSSLSSNKARGGTIGFLLGFFLGLLGILIVALIPTNKEGQWDREQSWRREQRLGQKPPLTRRPQRLANPPNPYGRPTRLAAPGPRRRRTR
jgi:uncharacterized membrane protein YeaQ/YmgE (transglycosylase-associated protein family)